MSANRDEQQGSQYTTTCGIKEQGFALGIFPVRRRHSAVVAVGLVSSAEINVTMKKFSRFAAVPLISLLLFTPSASAVEPGMVNTALGPIPLEKMGEYTCA